MKSLNQRKTAHDKPQLGPVFKHLFHLFQYIYFCFQLLNISIFVSGMNFLAQWSIFSFQSSNTLILVCKTNQEPYHENRTLKTKQNWKIKKFCREFSLPKWHWFWVKEYSDYLLWILKSQQWIHLLNHWLDEQNNIIIDASDIENGLNSAHNPWYGSFFIGVWMKIVYSEIISQNQLYFIHANFKQSVLSFFN